MDPLKLHLTARSLSVDTARRTITGIIAAVGVASTTQGVIFPTAASLSPRQPLKRVKLLTDHSLSDPVGYMTEYTPETLTAVFYVPEGDAGDKALTDAANGLRDGLSVGFHAKEYAWDDAYNIVIHEAELYEVSLVAVPDFADAQVQTVALAAQAKENPAMTAEQIAAMQAENARLTALTAAPAAPEQPAADPAPETPRTLNLDQFPQAGSTFTAPRAKSLREVALTVSEAWKGGDPAQIRLALSDVLPADDAGHGFLGRPGWLGEVWTAAKSGRPWIESFGTPGDLTSMKLEGWAWDVRPKPAKYSGNKTNVPSNKPKTKPVTADASRWAGGWDIDRIYFDLGSPDFLMSFWTAAAVEYDADSDSDVAKKVIEAATYAGAAPTAIAAISGIAADLRKIGAQASRIVLAEDVFEEYGSMSQADVPFWLANATGVSLAEATATVADLRIEADSQLEPGNVIGYDRRAAQVKEKNPIKIQAFDVAKAGVDLGFYSYGGVIINDPRAIIRRTVGDAPAPGAE